MTEKPSVRPDCKKASNPYHECSEKCFKVLSTTCKKASNPYHECSERCFEIVPEVQKNIKQNGTEMTGKGKQQESPRSNSLSFSNRNSGQYTLWNDKMDIILGNVLIGQMARANKCNIDTWKPQALKGALEFMKSTLDLNVTKDDIKDRIKLWKKYYKVVMDVKKQSGLFWDENQKMIIVTSNEMDKWANYVKAHPYADGMQNKVIKNWEDIVLLYGKDWCSAEDAATSNGGVEARGGGENEVDINATTEPPLLPSTSPSHEHEADPNATSPSHEHGADPNATSPSHEHGPDLNATSPSHENGADLNATSPSHENGADLNATSPSHEHGADLNATIEPPLQPSTSPSDEPNSQEETRKDALTDALIDAAASIKEYVEIKKKKEEIRQPSGVEIHEVVSNLPGLTPYEVFEAVQKLINGNPEQFFLLKSLPDEQKEQWVQFLLLP